ncbi:liver merozoite formation protein, putative [Plasmodium ovale]|nr:liver merozoite formation protein, putative [Plasmodium ovale]
MKLFSPYILAAIFLVGFTLSLCKKVLFVDLLNGINMSYGRKKYINKNAANNHEYFSSQSPFVNKNAAQALISREKGCTRDDTANDAESDGMCYGQDENVLRQYIYTLSHLAIFDIDREKDTPLNISLLLKACLASHNYIKNVEIYTSQVKNKEICSFIYENRKDFEDFFNLHILKYTEFFYNSKIDETLKSYIDDKNMYTNELEIYRKIGENTKLRKDILLDILFECTRLNKIIQYSLAVNKFNLLSHPVMLKVFAYFKTNDIYYYIFLNSIKKIKYYYAMKNVKEEYKQEIYKIVDYYLNILNTMDCMYEAGNIPSLIKKTTN